MIRILTVAQHIIGVFGCLAMAISSADTVVITIHVFNMDIGVVVWAFLVILVIIIQAICSIGIVRVIIWHICSDPIISIVETMSSTNYIEVIAWQPRRSKLLRMAMLQVVTLNE